MPTKADSFGQIAVAAPSLLGQLAAGAAGGGPPQTPPSPSPSPGGRGKGGVQPHPNGQGIDLEAFIARHGISVTRTEPYDGGTRFILDHCLFNPEHVGTSACLGRAASGAVWYKCQHTSCSGRGWKDLREHLEGARPGKGKAAGKKGKKKSDELPESAYERAQKFIDDVYVDDLGQMGLRYHQRQFWRFNRTSYVPLDEETLAASLSNWLGPRVEKPTGRSIADVITFVRASVGIPNEHSIPVMTSWSGSKRVITVQPGPCNLIAMANGIIDLDVLITQGPEAAAATMRPRSPDLFATSDRTFAFDPTATCPRWDDFLVEVFEENQECADLLGEWMGYCLTADTSRHKIMLLNGPVRAGKGTIIRVLKILVGDAAFQSTTFDALGDRYGMDNLMGKTVCFLPDAHVGHGAEAMRAMEILKNISGEDDVNIRGKYRRDIRARLGVRFMVACNELPKFGDSSQTVASRLLALPFRVSFLGREDINLEHKLAREASGIFNWAIGGLQRLRENGWTSPLVSEPILAEFRELSSPLATFLEDHCVVSPDLEVDRDDLWRAWCNWCSSNGHRAGSRELLGSRLRGLIPKLETTRRRGLDGLRRRAYVGVGVSSATLASGPKIGG